MAAVFVSYSRESETAVKTLATDVEELGHTVWFDHDLSGGKEWWEQILAEIRDCQVFMMALSPQSLRSTACTSECRYAADLGKPILPILITEGVSTKLLPPKLSQIHYVDYRKQDKTCVISLTRALKALPPAAALPDPLPPAPVVPLSYLGSITERIEDATALDLKDQSALVSDLRRSLRDPESLVEARGLLARLRKRRDLFATIADEIDELLDKPEHAVESDSSEIETASEEETEEAPAEEAPEATDEEAAGPEEPAETQIERQPPPPAPGAKPTGGKGGQAWSGAVGGAIFGAIVVGVVGGNPVVGAFFGAIIGAIIAVVF